MQVRLLGRATVTVDARPQRDGRGSVSAAELSTCGAGRMRFWRPLPPSVLDVICGEGEALEVPLHTHEALQVLLPVSRFAVLDGTWCSAVVSPGVIHVTSPLELHGVRSLDDAPVAMRVLLVAPAVLAKLQGSATVQACEGKPESTPCVVDDSALYADLSALFEELRRPLVSLDGGVRLLSCLRRLVGHLVEHPRMGAPRAPRPIRGAERAREHLRAHATEGVSLDELATVARLSKFFLLRAFRRAYGLTPHAYQMQLRLARARRLIADGRSLSYVAYEAGFADQSHLTRRFAAFYGLTPARYARQLAATASAAPHVSPYRATALARVVRVG